MNNLTLKNKALGIGANKVEINKGVAYFMKGASDIKKESIELEDVKIGFFNEDGIEVERSVFSDLVDETNTNCFSVKEEGGQINLVIKTGVRVL